ncbi:hypothetical protein F5Y03DRAFT_79406 [Xylaria venustula]|nr:hypothetical protein F5Y03DRAFT_79406 [Xylaria venustula]
MPVGCTYAVRQCPFCKSPNSRQLHVQPALARARVLVLENLSVLSAVCLIRDIRSRLFGPIYEYLDLVVGVNEGQLVAHDIFVSGLSTKESLEKNSSRNSLSRLKPAFARSQNPRAHEKLPGSFQIAFQYGSNILTSWVEVFNCPNRSSLADLPAAMITDFWASCDVLGVGLRDGAAPIAAALVASLFYAQVCSRASYDGTSHDLVALCRLEPGPHLMAVLKGLKDLKLHIYHQIEGAQSGNTLLCSDAEWDICKAGQPFMRSLQTISSLESEIHVNIDSLTQSGAIEPISNSPCTARAVATVVHGDGPDDSVSRCSDETFSEDDHADTISSRSSVQRVLHEGPQRAVKVVD